MHLVEGELYHVYKAEPAVFFSKKRKLFTWLQPTIRQQYLTTYTKIRSGQGWLIEWSNGRIVRLMITIKAAIPFAIKS